jgi:hypothetical protein
LVGIKPADLETAMFKKRSKVPKKSVSERMRDRRKRKGSGSERKAVAQTPAVADQSAAPPYKVYHVAVDEIKVVGKRRQVNPDKVQDLKGSVAKLGLRTPLTIRNVGGKKIPDHGAPSVRGGEGSRLGESALRVYHRRQNDGSAMGNIGKLAPG